LAVFTGTANPGPGRGSDRGVESDYVARQADEGAARITGLDGGGSLNIGRV